MYVCKVLSTHIEVKKPIYGASLSRGQNLL